MEKLKENQVYTGVVEGYSSEGLGIVRINGKDYANLESYL